MRHTAHAFVMVLVLPFAGCADHTAGGVDIWQAVRSDDPTAVETYAAAGGNLDVRDRDGRTPLFVALSDEKRGSYEALLKQGADPNTIMSGKRVVTHWAATKDDPWWINLALEHGADPNLVNVGDGSPGEGTPLHFAIGNGEVEDSDASVEIVRLLCEHGADVNKPGRFDSFPLADAVTQNKFRIVMYLLENGADINRSQLGGISFLTYMRERCENRDNWFRQQEDRDEVDAIRAWLESRGVDVMETK